MSFGKILTKLGNGKNVITTSVQWLILRLKITRLLNAADECKVLQYCDISCPIIADRAAQV